MATSYANAGGTGDRTAGITVTTNTQWFGGGTQARLVDGIIGTNNSFFSGGSSVGNVIKFDFGASASKIIDKFKWYQQSAANQGTWKWQGSNDDSTYVDLGSSFTLDGISTGSEITEPAGNVTGYRWYQMVLIAGATNSGPYVYEIEFNIDDAVPAGVTGTLAATEGADVAAFVGNQGDAVTGTLVATEAPDIMAIYGTTVSKRRRVLIIN